MPVGRAEVVLGSGGRRGSLGLGCELGRLLEERATTAMPTVSCRRPSSGGGESDAAGVPQAPMSDAATASTTAARDLTGW